MKPQTIRRLMPMMTLSASFTRIDALRASENLFLTEAPRTVPGIEMVDLETMEETESIIDVESILNDILGCSTVTEIQLN